MNQRGTIAGGDPTPSKPDLEPYEENDQCDATGAD
jgi:hypothetical protein